MSDISTEITRLQNAKSKLIEFGNTFCPKLFDSSDPVTIDNIAEALASFASKVTGTVLIKNVSNSDTLQPLIASAETQQRPIVIFVNGPTAMVANLGAIKISESCGAIFVRIMSTFSYPLGNYDVSTLTQGDVCIIDPFTSDVTKLNFAGAPTNAAKQTLSVINSILIGRV